MAPTESAIGKAIDALVKSPGLFQRLVEDFVEIEFSALFPSLSPGGRNAHDVAIKGWPDMAYQGNFAEASISKQWKSHLRKDLERARVVDNLTGFVFVCWAKGPPAAGLNQIVLEISKTTGLPATSIHLIFRQRLVRSLRKPRFTRQWIEILGLPPLPHPFILVSKFDVPGDPSNRLFGSGNAGASFLPTRAEYRSKLVHQPTAQLAVVQSLATQGYALVRGRGACGKSTLAMSLALSEPYASGAAYYLDIIEASTAPGVNTDLIIEKMASYGDRNVLFIVDNFHHSERIAADILNSWRDIGDGSRLLLLGRIRGSYADPRHDPPLFDDVTSITLGVSSDDLLGVCGRILGVDAGADPPAPQVQKWFDLFQGDLVAFGAAVHKRRRDLVRGKWSLSAQDAADYVRSAYLTGLTDAEHRNLLRLSLAFISEHPLPEAALDGGGFELSIQRGVVHDVYLSRRSGQRKYSLVHAGVGSLILAAAGVSDLQPLRAEIAERSPQLGLAFASYLEDQGDAQSAQDLYRHVWDRSPWPIGASDLSTLLVETELLGRYHELSAADITNRLEQNRPILDNIILNVPINDLIYFLKRARARNRDFHEIICARLRTDDVIYGLIAILQRSSPHWSINFLDLFREDKSLVEKHSLISDRLYSAGFTERIRESLEAADLSILMGVSRYLYKTDPSAYRELYRYLAEPASARALVDKAYRSSPQGFLSLLRERRLARLILQRIDLAKWEEAYLSKVISPDFICSLEEELTRYGAPYLAVAPARALIRNSTPERWSRSRASFVQVKTTLRLAQEPPPVLTRFVSSVLVEGGYFAEGDAAELYWLCSRMLISAAEADGDVLKMLHASGLERCIEPAIHGADVHIVSEAAAFGLVGITGWMGTTVTESIEVLGSRDNAEELFELGVGSLIGLGSSLDLALFLRGVWEVNMAAGITLLAKRIRRSSEEALKRAGHEPKLLPLVADILCVI